MVGVSNGDEGPLLLLLVARIMSKDFTLSTTVPKLHHLLLTIDPSENKDGKAEAAVVKCELGVQSVVVGSSRWARGTSYDDMIM